MFHITSPNKTWNYPLARTLLLMVPFDLLASLGMDIYLPALPGMGEFFSASPFMVQLTLSLYMLMLGCGQLIFGPLSDRYGRRPVLLFGCLLFVICSIGLTMTGSIELFIFFRLCQAAGGSAALVATFATVRDVYGHKPESATLYALLGGMLAFVPALGPIVGSLLIGWFGWASVFWGLAVSGSVAGVHALFSWPETHCSVGGGSIKHAFGRVITSPAFLLYTSGFTVAMGSFFVYFSIAPGILIGKLGYSSLVFSLLFAMAAVAMIIVSRFAGSIARKFGISGTLKLGMAVILAGALLMLLGSTLQLPEAPVLLLPMMVIAVGISITCSVCATGALAEFKDIAGTGVALYYCLEAVLVCLLGTAVVMLFPVGSLWPLIAFSGIGSLVVMASAAWINK
ncbi:CmlA/FloR family chloramphenicol efflux MFS transporter [Endozoicomonas elysicola]|uniref:CmlA/FloR family chloramphenicol efflux MFS transporter n=1 Tax=Endozoicomonas elysicola TaxID=305900 RepID=UPI0003A2033E|nr:CmlA/FloR family chloramphenicol efflux MFS transporter [Endozoicomonas elysicola]